MAPRPREPAGSRRAAAACAAGHSGGAPSQPSARPPAGEWVRQAVKLCLLVIGQHVADLIAHLAELRLRVGPRLGEDRLCLCLLVRRESQLVAQPPQPRAAAGWRLLFFVGAAPALLTVFVIPTLRESDKWKAARATRTLQRT